MKALVLFANGFEEVEAITQVDFLRRGGIEVTAASIHNDKRVVGAHNIPVEADALLADDLDLDSIDSIDLIVKMKEFMAADKGNVDPSIFKTVKTVQDVVDALVPYMA